MKLFFDILAKVKNESVGEINAKTFMKALLVALAVTHAKAQENILVKVEIGCKVEKCVYNVRK